MTPVELGILSLSDLQTSPDTGQSISAAQRVADTLEYAVLAERLGLDVFALGEHHTLEFAVSSPAVVLAAIVARTERIRLTSAVTVLSALDPVRVYQDFAQLDLVSNGRVEIIAGRNASTEPFALFGHRLEDYDALFAEKLDLLLRVRGQDRITWTGRFRPPLHDAPITPRATQQELPIWAGVGASPGSAERAGRPGLPCSGPAPTRANGPRLPRPYRRPADSHRPEHLPGLISRGGMVVLRAGVHTHPDLGQTVLPPWVPATADGPATVPLEATSRGSQSAVKASGAGPGGARPWPPTANDL